LGKSLFDLPGRDLESTDRNLEILDEPASGSTRKTPVIHLGAGGMIFPSAHQPVADFEDVLPGADSSAHPDDRHACRLRRVGLPGVGPPRARLFLVRLLFVRLPCVGGFRDPDDRPSSGRLGRLLEKDMGVGPPEAESADGRPTWMTGRRLPWFGTGEHTKRTVIQIDVFSGFLEVGGGWKNLVLHRQYCFQEAYGSGAREQMAGIRLG